MNTPREERLALRRIEEAQDRLRGLTPAIRTLVSLGISGIVVEPMLWFWGYLGKYAHIDRALTVIITTFVLLVVIGICFGVASELDKGRHNVRRELRNARYHYEDLMADDEPIVLPDPQPPTTKQLLEQISGQATPQEILKLAWTEFRSQRK